MKSLLVISVLLLYATNMNAQDLKPIKLNEPDKNRGTSVMKALDNRRSIREFSTEKLSIQDLSDLLWAANGINRPDGRRTAATARNNQDIDIYVIMEEGSYLYEAKTSELKPVATGDFRELIAATEQQAWAKDAPVTLLIVSDISRFVGWDIEMQKYCGALDAGIVSQNIMLFASGCGLATVPRVYMKNDELKKALNLTDTQIPMINTPVGYPKK
jgi:SagB-type dehydrogenase family enzyme